jgi:CDP-glycerol glycerophosphotransferase (TagB/SpsB family)
MPSDNNNGVYYFLGNIPSHILHALPLYRQLGGTFVVTSRQAKAELAPYDVPVICIDNINPTFQRNIDRVRIRLGFATYSLQLGRSLRRTFRFLEQNARIVIFYELFEFTKHTELSKPRTIFLAHGSALKDFMSMYPRRQEIVKQYDYMAGLGPDVKQGFIDNGSVPAEKLVDLGVARTDEIYATRQRKDLRETIAREVGFDSRKTIVSYFTTFWGPSSIYHTAKEIIRNVSDEYILLFQLHPQTPAEIRAEYDALIASRPNVFWSYKNLYPSLSLPVLMCGSDLILGDVSSVVLESLLADKPMVFVYDVGEHRQSEDYYKNIRDVVNWSEHIDMENVVDTNRIFKAALDRGIDKKIWQEAKDQNFYHHDGTSIKAIVDFVNSIS